MPTPLIELKIDASQNIETGKYWLKIKVERYENIDAEVFVFQRDMHGDDTFAAIATPAQLVGLPKNQPVPGNLWFLDSYVELQFDNILTRQDVEARIVQEVKDLVVAWEILGGTVNSTRTVTITGAGS